MEGESRGGSGRHVTARRVPPSNSRTSVNIFRASGFEREKDSLAGISGSPDRRAREPGEASRNSGIRGTGSVRVHGRAHSSLAGSGSYANP